MKKILWILGQYNSRHVIKHVTLKFKNGTFSIKIEYIIVLTIFQNKLNLIIPFKMWYLISRILKLHFYYFLKLMYYFSKHLRINLNAVINSFKFFLIISQHTQIILNKTTWLNSIIIYVSVIPCLQIKY